MAERTDKEHAIVLTKTKLGESDLIIRMLGEQGSLIEAVAKGARKPSGTHSARLEILNEVEVMLASGKNLDIIKEARLLSAPSSSRYDPLRGAAASLVAEFSAKAAQRDLEVERFFDLVRTTISYIDACEERTICAAAAAFQFKASSIMGFKPSFLRCPICTTIIDGDAEGSVRFSYASGGTICDECSSIFESKRIPYALAQWGELLIRSRFDDLEQLDIPQRESVEMLDMALRWVDSQMGITLKSAKSLKKYLAQAYSE